MSYASGINFKSSVTPFTSTHPLSLPAGVQPLWISNDSQNTPSRSGKQLAFLSHFAQEKTLKKIQLSNFFNSEKLESTESFE
jgi:hypothetical protein